MAGPRSKRFRWRRRAILLLVAPTIVAACFSRPHISEDSTADIAVDFGGWLLFLCGALMRLWATLHIGGRKSEALVTDGPYSLCRNPLYVGTFLLGLSVAAFLMSATVLVAVLLGLSLCAAGTIPAEEQFLREKFGSAYESYGAQTPRFFPRFRSFRAPEVLPVHMRTLRKELTGALGWSAIPFLGELLAHARMLTWWPTPLHIP